MEESEFPPEGEFLKRREWQVAEYNRLVEKGEAARLARHEWILRLGLPQTDAAIEYEERFGTLRESGMPQAEAHRLVINMDTARGVLKEDSPAWLLLLSAFAMLAAVVAFIVLLVLPPDMIITPGKIMLCIVAVFSALVYGWNTWHHYWERAWAHDILAKGKAVFREIPPLPPLPPLPPV